MLKGEKVLLRFVEEADIPLFCQLRNNIEEMGAYWTLMAVKSEPQLRRTFLEHGFWKEENGMLLIINAEGEIAGYIMYLRSFVLWDALEVGYRIFESKNWGKGLATEALKLFSAFLFEAKNISRLQCFINTENRPSACVAEKAGYQFEGIARAAFFSRGKHQDMMMYSMLRSKAQSLVSVMKPSPA